MTTAPATLENNTGKYEGSKLIESNRQAWSLFNNCFSAAFPALYASGGPTPDGVMKKIATITVL
jgi:hypothetical protein